MTAKLNRFDARKKRTTITWNGMHLAQNQDTMSLLLLLKEKVN